MKNRMIACLCLLMGLSAAACTGNAEPEPSGTEETVSGSALEETGADYESTLFDSSHVHTIDIEITEEDWEDLPRLIAVT